MSFQNEFSRRFSRFSTSGILSLALVLCFLSSAPAQEVCGDYDGCDPVILKVRGTVTNLVGTPILDATLTATENRRRDVNTIEFFEHCGLGLHLPTETMVSVSTSLSSQDPGFYELLIIVCAQDKGDFAADFDVCVEAPGFEPTCLVAEFDGSDDREGLDFMLPPSSKGSPETVSAPKGPPTGDCGDYSDCSMTLLKVRGYVRDEGGQPIANAEVTGVLTNSRDVNAIQFYSHCGNGSHNLRSDKVSLSQTGTSLEDGFYELLFSVCGEDNNDILPDEFDADIQVCATAPGFLGACLVADFDEDDHRKDRDFALLPGAGPTETPTPSATATEEATAAPTALNPEADVNGDGVIDHLDLLEILGNWYRIVE